jgi:hypothetical protein
VEQYAAIALMVIAGEYYQGFNYWDPRVMGCLPGSDSG